MNNGLVIYSGEKEGYGKTVIVQRADNIEIWYCNLNNIGANLYDYIKKGDTIGEVSESTLYLVFTKEGKTLDYKKYI